MKSKIIRIIAIIVTVVVILILSYLIGTGFMVRTDVVLNDFSVSEDGSTLILKLPSRRRWDISVVTKMMVAE